MKYPKKNIGETRERGVPPAAKLSTIAMQYSQHACLLGWKFTMVSNFANGRTSSNIFKKVFATFEMPRN